MKAHNWSILSVELVCTFQDRDDSKYLQLHWRPASRRQSQYLQHLEGALLQMPQRQGRCWTLESARLGPSYCRQLHPTHRLSISWYPLILWDTYTLYTMTWRDFPNNACSLRNGAHEVQGYKMKVNVIWQKISKVGCTQIFNKVKKFCMLHFYWF